MKRTIVLFAGAVMLVSCNQEKTLKMEFETCTIEYKSRKISEKEMSGGHVFTNEMEVEAARRKLGYCLCESWLASPRENTGEKIIEIYHTKETFFPKPFRPDLPVDSICAKRDQVFYSSIIVD